MIVVHPVFADTCSICGDRRVYSTLLASALCFKSIEIETMDKTVGVWKQAIITESAALDTVATD